MHTTKLPFAKEFANLWEWEYKDVARVSWGLVLRTEY